MADTEKSPAGLGMAWTDRLRKAIVEQDWDDEHQVVPPSLVEVDRCCTSLLARIKTIEVDTGWDEHPPVAHAHIPFALNLLLGLVNASEFCGAPPGALLTSQVRHDRGHGLILGFTLRERPWNLIPGPDGRWVEYRDAEQSTLYQAADFAGAFAAIAQGWET